MTVVLLSPRMSPSDASALMCICVCVTVCEQPRAWIRYFQVSVSRVCVELPSKAVCTPRISRHACRVLRTCMHACMHAMRCVCVCVAGYPECRVVIYHVAKKANIGTIVRTAVAFGATQIIVVGNVSGDARAPSCAHFCRLQHP